MTHFKNFRKFNALLYETFLSLEGERSGLLASLRADSKQDFILLGLGFNAWEEISNETKEDRTIINSNLGHVEITEGSHQNDLFGNIGVGTLKLTGLSEHRLNCTKSPIVMDHLGKQGFGEVVKSHELLGQIPSSLETFRHKHVFANKHHVGSDHSARAEQSLQVFWQLGTASVTRIHGDPETNGNFNANFLLEEEEHGLVLVDL